MFIFVLLSWADIL